METLDFIYTSLILTESLDTITRARTENLHAVSHIGTLILFLLGVCIALNYYFSACARASREKFDKDENEKAKKPIQVAMPTIPPPEHRMKVYIPDAPFNLYHPKFDGKPHEVLGVDSTAGTKWIHFAYKHWMKEYHPDHLTKISEKERNEANVNCQRLHMAKDTLLQRRKKSA